MAKISLVLEAWGKGGTETYACGLIKTLLAHGHEVELVLLQRTNDEIIDCLPADKVHHAGLVSLAGVLSRLRPDVLSLHLYTSLLSVVVMSRLLGIPNITTLHMPLSAWGLRHRLYWRCAIRLANRLVPVSRQVADDLPVMKATTPPVPGGVNALFFNVKRQTLVTRHDYRILAMGRLSREKDWPTLIHAVARLPSHLGRQVTLHFYGSGSLLNELESKARDEGVNAVFHGFVDKGSLAEALNHANLSVLPSRFEGLGLSALEGMAAGVPTITADFLASKDFIEHGVTGHTFPAGNPDELACLIQWHMGHPELAEHIGKAGQEFVRARFSEETTYLPYLGLIHEVIH